MQYTYDIDGRVTTVKDANLTIAVLAYDSTGQLVSETHPAASGTAAGNGTAWTDLTRNAAGALTGMSHTFPAAAIIREDVIRSQAGRILKTVTTRGGTVNTSTYGYGTAGGTAPGLVDSCPVDIRLRWKDVSMPKPYPIEFRRDVVAVARKHEAPLAQIAKDGC